MGKELGGESAECPVAEDVSGRLVRLPFFSNMSNEEVERVVCTVQSYSM